MDFHEHQLRKEIIQTCLDMNRIGLNQGTSGNVSARLDNCMLITPSAIAYDQLEPEMIASMPFDGIPGEWNGPLRPSIEWRFHLDILKSRNDVNATVHCHPPNCTAIAMARMNIPACHYMVAAFGGNSVRCSSYELPGSPELSRTALRALEGRSACLLANHGSIAVGESLKGAIWTAVELETLARQYLLSLQLVHEGGPKILGSDEIEGVLDLFKSYGKQEDST